MEVLCVQLFFFLRDHPEWLRKGRLDTQTMATLCKKSPGSLEELEPKKLSNAQGPPIMSKGASPVTEIKSPGGTTGDITHPKEIGQCPHSSASTPLPRTHW
jgi:hypothetical protein